MKVAVPAFCCRHRRNEIIWKGIQLTSAALSWAPLSLEGGCAFPSETQRWILLGHWGCLCGWAAAGSQLASGTRVGHFSGHQVLLWWASIAKGGL